MTTRCVLALLSCLALSPPCRGDEGVEIDFNRMPQAARDRLAETFPGADFLQAWQIVENGNECYVVRPFGKDSIREYYVSPDGAAIIIRDQVISATQIPRWLLGILCVALVPGALAGACTRWLAQGVYEGKLSVVSEWLVAWLGATLGIGFLLSQVARVPRYTDSLADVLACLALGAISASIVEVLGLTAQSLRGYRARCCRTILVTSVTGFVFLALSAPIDMLRIERQNQHFKSVTLRPANP
jgi:hypothetical protein